MKTRVPLRRRQEKGKRSYRRKLGQPMVVIQVIPQDEREQAVHLVCGDIWLASTRYSIIAETCKHHRVVPLILNEQISTNMNKQKKEKIQARISPDAPQTPKFAQHPVDRCMWSSPAEPIWPRLDPVTLCDVRPQYQILLKNSHLIKIVHKESCRLLKK